MQAHWYTLFGYIKWNRGIVKAISFTISLYVCELETVMWHCDHTRTRVVTDVLDKLNELFVVISAN